MALAKNFTFTDERIAALPTPRAETIFCDIGCKGLFLRVGTSGTKTFFCFGWDETGKRTKPTIGRWSASGMGGTYTVDTARAKFLDSHGAAEGTGGELLTVGEIFDKYAKREQVAEYTLDLLRTHLESVRDRVASKLGRTELPDLVVRVMRKYENAAGKRVGGKAVADKVRSGLVHMFEWAQRQGHFPDDLPLPTRGLVREDFKGIGWKAKERKPSERELHQLFDALGIGTGEEITIDMKVNPRISLEVRLATLLIMHVPVRSGVGILSRAARAADLDECVLRWSTRKGGRTEKLIAPLSSIAVKIIKELNARAGGKEWLVPSPTNPKQHLDLKALSHVFRNLQTRGRTGEPPRIVVDEGEQRFTPHSMRALWSTTAGELEVIDGVSVRVLGHKPKGQSDAQKFYDLSKRESPQRVAVERLSAELERIRRRLPTTVVTAEVIPLRTPA